MSDSERRPGRGRYSHWERERRFLLPALPDGLTDPRAIEDIYLIGTTLRLRRVGAGAAAVHKLTQKVRPDPADPSAVRITNVYVTEHELLMLSALGGARITKTRWIWPSSPYVVDEFHGHLDGLVLAEVELEDPDADTIADPPGAIAEVTTDDRFSGGSLAAATRADLEAALASVRGKP